MTDREIMNAFGELRTLATNVIGFHALAEADDIARRPVDRLQYEAQVYAGGVALAVRLSTLMAAMAERKDGPPGR